MEHLSTKFLHVFISSIDPQILWPAFEIVVVSVPDFEEVMLPLLHYLFTVFVSTKS